MRKLLSLVLVTGLSGCLVVTEDDYDRRYVAPPRRPPPPPAAYHLDCAWLAAWNCWDRAVAEAEACAPETWAGRHGGLFVDHGYACYYPDGSAVYFEEPVTAPLSPYHRWSFSMEDPRGRTCGWFVETATGVSLGTASGVVDVVVDAAGISVTCQDGTEWFNRDPWALTYCAGYDWGSPGYWRDQVRSTTTFGLLGGDVPALWSCGW